MRIPLILLVPLLLCACHKPVFRTRWTKEQAPERFVARFETAKGSFDITLQRGQSPKAVDRVYQLITHHFFDSSLFYRVVPNFVAQFGNPDTVKQRGWEKMIIPDEPVIYGNRSGSVSFARSGKNSRSVHLFINLKDNPKLDTISFSGVTGFPAFGDVTQGMDVVRSLYDGYGDAVFKKYELMYKNQAAFMDSFPRLDRISKAYILEKIPKTNY